MIDEKLTGDVIADIYCDVARAERRVAITTLEILNKEVLIRPKMLEVFGKFPSLLVDYFTLQDINRQLLDDFRRRYPRFFEGSGDGCGVKYLVDQYITGPNVIPAPRGGQHVADLARKCRWSNQLLKIFDFYRSKTPEATFNNAYIGRRPEARKKFGGMGYNIIQNTRNGFMTVDDIVEIAAEAEPDVKDAYVSRR